MGNVLTTLLALVVLLFSGAYSTEAVDVIGVKVNATSRAQGEVLLVQVSGVKDAPEGTFLDTPLNFQRVNGNWLALKGISYWTEPGVYTLEVKTPDGEIIKQAVQIKKGNFKESHLTVSESQSRIVNPKPEDKEIIARKERDAKRIESAYANPAAEPLWKGPFMRPTEGRKTTGFGDTRYVNGQVNNRHSGIDIANTVGTSINAVNDGIVRLAEDLLATGFTIIIDHGAGLYSSYSHMSRLLVKPGDKVAKGQLIGKMGSTGFSTGSHLHWVMRTGADYLDPEQFLGTDLFKDITVKLE